MGESLGIAPQTSASGPSDNNEVEAENDALQDAHEGRQLLESRPDVWQPALAQYRQTLQQRSLKAEQASVAQELEQGGQLARRLTLKFGRKLDTALDADQRHLEDRNHLDLKERKREAAREGWKKRKAAAGGKSKRRKR